MGGEINLKICKFFCATVTRCTKGTFDTSLIRILYCVEEKKISEASMRPRYQLSDFFFFLLHVGTLKQTRLISCLRILLNLFSVQRKYFASLRLCEKITQRGIVGTEQNTSFLKTKI